MHIAIGLMDMWCDELFGQHEYICPGLHQPVEVVGSNSNGGVGG